MSSNKELEEVLQLVERMVRWEEIANVLRKRKGDEHIRISAETKEALVQQNVREAVEAKVVDISELFALIEASEESGNQHIFYYRPLSKKIAEAMAFADVGERLWGQNWKNKVKADFPSVLLKPEDYKYADFRLYSAKKPHDWILKVYGQKTILRSTDIERVEDGKLWRQFDKENLRIVLSARWNFPDLLEIRIQRNESRRRMDEWFRKMWQMLSPSVTTTQFSPWSLTGVMKTIVLNFKKNSAIYEFRDIGIVDKDQDVHATFEAFSDQGSLFKNEQTETAIKSYLAANGSLRGLAVRWLARPASEPQKEIKSLLGLREPHEAIISAHCSAEDLDYVTEQLRHFSK